MKKTENILRLPMVILILAVAFIMGRYSDYVSTAAESVYGVATYAMKTIISYAEPGAKEVDPRELKCMTDNIYYEAGNQSSIGKIAVGRVVLNRLEDGRFPSSVCGVVYQKAQSTCQFSWTCARKLHAVEDSVYEESREIAYKLLAFDSFKDSFKNVLFYHADYVAPYWSKKFKVAAKIDNHIFYKESK